MCPQHDNTKHLSENVSVSHSHSVAQSILPTYAARPDDSYCTSAALSAKRRLANYSFDANQSCPLLSRKLNTSLRHELELITPPANRQQFKVPRHQLPQLYHQQQRLRPFQHQPLLNFSQGSSFGKGNVSMDTIRVDGANGLRFSARRKIGGGGGGSGCYTPGTGSPFGGNDKSGSYTAAVSNNGGGGNSECTFLRAANCSAPLHGQTQAIGAVANVSIAGGDAPPAGINPHKAVFTIDSHTSRILIVNHNACVLLGYTSRELCDMLFADLLAPSSSNKSQLQPHSGNATNRSHVSALAEGQLNTDDGTMVLLSGKVVEMCTKQPVGGRVAVSLWIRQIDVDGRCLAVAEPVERRIAQLHIDRNGGILCGDAEALLLFQLDGGVEQFAGMDVQQLIPAIVLPDWPLDSSQQQQPIAKHVRKQKATGRTADGITFPLCLLLAVNEEVAAAGSAASASTVESGDSGVSNGIGGCAFVVTVWVFQNLSGLVVMDERGVIESCNHHFSMLMFGYAQMRLLGQHITELIPNFGLDVEYVPETVRSRTGTLSMEDGEGEQEDDGIMDDDEYVDEEGVDYESEDAETDPVYYENEAFVMSEGGGRAAEVSAVPMAMSVSSVYLQATAIGDEMLMKARSEPLSIAGDRTNDGSFHGRLLVDREPPLCRRSACLHRENLHSHATMTKSEAKHDLLRTPVNESATGCGPFRAGNSRPITPAAKQQQQNRCYQLSDISDALRVVETSTGNATGDANGTRDGNVIMDSPKFNPQQSDAGKFTLSN